MPTEEEKVKRTRRRAKMDEAKEASKLSQVYEFVNSEPWHVVRKKLVDKIVALDSIINMPDEKCTRQDVLANRRAVVILYQFLGELEGNVKEYLMYLNSHKEKKEEQVILNLEDQDDE